jgi:cold shock CspA family protein
MRQGKVKWYNGKKCYGFVTPETPNAAGSTEDVFVHSTSLKNADIRFLNEGDIIEFDEEIRGGKLSATEIKLIKRDEESAKRFQERRAQYSDRGDRPHRDYGDRPRGPRRDGDRRDGEKKGFMGFFKK